MDNQLENNDWKKEAPTLAALDIHNPFSTPARYFEGLSLEIAGRLYFDTLKDNIPEGGFSVPENYFNELNENINADILKEKIRSAVPDGNNYAVPVNYFEQLQSNILSKTVHEAKKIQPTKIVRLLHSSIMKYASAACFVILSTTGFYFYKQHTPTQQRAYTDLATEQLLYDIDEDVIIDHIEDNSLQAVKPAATDVALENYILSNYSQNEIASNL